VKLLRGDACLSLSTALKAKEGGWKSDLTG
jgi:hypothetical protein